MQRTDPGLEWCQWNCLQMKVIKTKELVVDFLRCIHSLSIPVNIQGMDIDMVTSYQNLGVHLKNKLDWTENTSEL